MAEKNRIQNLSTRWLLPFKGVVIAIYLALCSAIVWMFLQQEDDLFSWILGLANAGFYVYFFFRLMKMTAKLHRVEFDSDFLYVLLNKQDLIIPLEGIKSVEISTL